MYMPELFEEWDKEEEMYLAENYIKEALDSFERDPADSDYQKGYEAALKELKKYLDKMRKR